MSKTTLEPISSTPFGWRDALSSEIPSRSAGSLAKLARSHGFEVRVLVGAEPFHHAELCVAGINVEARAGFRAWWADGKSDGAQMWSPASWRVVPYEGDLTERHKHSGCMYNGMVMPTGFGGRRLERVGGPARAVSVTALRAILETY